MKQKKKKPGNKDKQQINMEAIKKEGKATRREGRKKRRRKR